MRGIIKLTPIDKPVEGMQVVTNGKMDIIEQYPISNNDGYDVSLSQEGTQVIRNLKQIVIEYTIEASEIIKPSESATKYQKQVIEEAIKRCISPKATLPLHPSDWEAALPLIGKEVEIIEEEIYIGRPGNGFHRAGLQRFAKLILPKQDSLSEVIKTKEQADRFMKDLRALSEQEETWDDIKFEYVKTYPCIEKNTPTYEQWIRKHYSPPKRLKS